MNVQLGDVVDLVENVEARLFGAGGSTVATAAGLIARVGGRGNGNGGGVVRVHRWRRRGCQ